MCVPSKLFDSLLPILPNPLGRCTACRDRAATAQSLVCDGMLRAPCLKVALAHRPAAEASARHVHLSIAAARQTRHHRAVMHAVGALVSRRRPHGRLQADNTRTNDMHARRPDGAVAVHPHLKGVGTRARHAGEQLSRTVGRLRNRRCRSRCRNWPSVLVADS